MSGVAMSFVTSLKLAVGVGEQIYKTHRDAAVGKKGVSTWMPKS